MDDDPAVRDIAATPSPGGSTTGNAPDPGLRDPTETSSPVQLGAAFPPCPRHPVPLFPFPPLSVLHGNLDILLSYSLFNFQFSLLLLPIPPLSVFSPHRIPLQHTTQHLAFTHFQALGCRSTHAFTSNQDTEFNLHVVVETYVSRLFLPFAPSDVPPLLPYIRSPCIAGHGPQLPRVPGTRHSFPFLFPFTPELLECSPRRTPKPGSPGSCFTAPLFVWSDGTLIGPREFRLLSL